MNRDLPMSRAMLERSDWLECVRMRMNEFFNSQQPIPGGAKASPDAQALNTPVESDRGGSVAVAHTAATVECSAKHDRYRTNEQELCGAAGRAHAIISALNQLFYAQSSPGMNTIMLHDNKLHNTVCINNDFGGTITLPTTGFFGTTQPVCTDCRFLAAENTIFPTGDVTHMTNVMLCATKFQTTVGIRNGYGDALLQPTTGSFATPQPASTDSRFLAADNIIFSAGDVTHMTNVMLYATNFQITVGINNGYGGTLLLTTTGSFASTQPVFTDSPYLTAGNIIFPQVTTLARPTLCFAPPNFSTLSASTMVFSRRPLQGGPHLQHLSARQLAMACSLALSKIVPR